MGPTIDLKKKREVKLLTKRFEKDESELEDRRASASTKSATMLPPIHNSALRGQVRLDLDKV